MDNKIYNLTYDCLDFVQKDIDAQRQVRLEILYTLKKRVEDERNPQESIDLLRREGLSENANKFQYENECIDQILDIISEFEFEVNNG